MKAAYAVAALLPILNAMMAAEPLKAQTLTLNATLTLPGSFLKAGSVAISSKSKNVFAAANQGTVFVVDATKSLREVGTVPLPGLTLGSAGTDGSGVYVVGANSSGSVITEFNANAPFNLIQSLTFTQPLSGLFVDGNGLFVSTGSSTMTADANHIYLSSLNAGEQVLVLNKKNLSVKMTLNALDVNAVNVFDRTTGQFAGFITNPLDYLGRPLGVNLYSDGITLALSTTAYGNTNAGVYLYDARTLARRSVINEPYANTVVTFCANNLQRMVIGTELGTVVLYDVTNPAAPKKLSSVNLTQTFNRALGDIEIRSLAYQNGSILAGSSWGTASDPTLPSFFALELK